MLRLLLPLLIGTASADVGAAVRHTKRKTVLLSAVAFFALAGVIFLFVTLYLALARTLGDIYAALIVALGCLTVAVIGLIAVRILDARRERRRVQERQQFDISTVATAAALALRPELLKRPLIAAALPIVGFAAYAFLSNGEKGHEKPRSPAKNI